MKKVVALRRSVALMLAVLAVAAALSGCHRLVADEAETIRVYATFHPIYALTEAVMRDVPDTQLRLLVQPQDGCLRSYQLSDWDVRLLARGADAVVMGGRGLESFEGALFGWGDDGPAMSAVLYNLELYNPGGSADGESESHFKGPNPHLYMSLEGAGRMLESIAATMVSLDPRYADLYARNAESAAGRIEAALTENRAALNDLSGSRVILMNEALVYVARDYGLEIADWVERESGEALYDQALSDCLARLTEAGANVVLIEKQVPRAFVEAIEAAGFAVARLDILSTHRDGEGFDTYIDIQKSNAQAIRAAFDRARAGEGVQ